MDIRSSSAESCSSACIQPSRARHALAAALAIALTAAATPALAIDDDEGTSLLRTSFGSPGARAAGMGGAFIGLADDSSAAFLNPAGLVLLPQKEVTLELRNRRSDLTYRTTAPPDAVSGSGTSGTTISYLSLALPFDKWGLGFFYGSLADADFSASSSRFGIGGGFELFPTEVSVELQDRYFGVGVAREITDTFRLGASVYRVSRELNSRTIIDQTSSVPPMVPRFGTYSSSTDDSDFGFNLGLHWSASERWTVGFNYRSELEFGADGSFVTEVRGGPSPSTTRVELSGGTTIIPSAATIGLGFRPNANWLFALDVSRILYSDLIDGASSFNDEPDGTFGSLSDLSAEDSTDVRFGVEYAVESDLGQWFWRAGVWREGDASLRASASSTSATAAFSQALFPGFDDQTHLTLGLGYAGERFGVDAAYDRADRDSEFVLSAVYYFE